MFIAITIGILDEHESLWSNGIKQNAFSLAKALIFCPSVETAVVFNTTAVVRSTQLLDDIYTFDDIKDRADVVIELGGQLDAEQTTYLKNRSCRLVSYCCGSEYIHVMESILFGRDLFGDHLYVNQRYDALWMIPQVESTSRAYFETLRKIKGTVVPFVWDPTFLESACVDLPNHGLWSPTDMPHRITIFEPNIDIVKFCLYPLFIVELAFRQSPDAIKVVQVTNTHHLANRSKEFNALMYQLDIVKNQRAVFLGRHDTPEFLSENTDIVVSHQWENPLNYIYLEVSWQGYPLIHNADMCADIGYYYDKNDLDTGASLLLAAMHEHKDHYETYRTRQRQNIHRFLPGAPRMTATYERLLQQLLAAPIR